MISKFRLNIIIRNIFILINVFFISYFLVIKRLYITGTGLCILFVFQLILLISYIEKNTRQVKTFFSSIRNNDYSVRFADNRGRTFSELSNEMNTIIKDIGKLKVKNEAQFMYLNTVINQAVMGLITIENEEKIEFINQTALHYLKMTAIKSPEQLICEYPQFDEIIRGHARQLIIRIDSLITLAVNMEIISLADRKIQIITLQNIRKELDEKEFISWEKLIHVLSHEIMNSITPINTLSETIENLVTSSEEADIKKINEASVIISRRSKNLMSFVQSYKNLLTIPKVRKTKIDLAELSNHVHSLFREETESANIKYNIKTSPLPFYFSADKILMEQIFINLFKNSIEALENSSQPKIELSAWVNINGKTEIKFRDTGCGIPPDKLEDVFIPFYTTKKNGNGIGLSLVREIMRMHDGTVNIESGKKGTTITLLF